MIDETAPTLTEFTLDRVDPRVRLFRCEREVDTCAVVTERYVVLVDTMATPALAADIMDHLGGALTGRGLLVVNTHADWDHAWGNATFATPGGRYPAPIIGHEETRRRLLGAQEEEYLRTKAQAEPRFAGVRLVAPAITVTEGLRIDGGDLTLELLPTPGHTPDHLSVWIPELRTVLAGDAAERPIPYVNKPGDLPLLRASLARLAALDPAAVIPCHGGVSDPALLARNMAYIDALARHARSALDDGRVLPDWAGRDDLPARIDLPFEAVAPDMQGEPAEVVAFYQASHIRAIRAMLTNLSAG